MTENAREAARQGDGKFGTQEHTLPTRRLSDSLKPLIEADGHYRVSSLSQADRNELELHIERARADLMELQYKVDAATLSASMRETYPQAVSMSFIYTDERIRNAVMLDDKGEPVVERAGWENDPSMIVGNSVSNAVLDDLYNTVDFEEASVSIDFTADEPCLGEDYSICDNCGRKTVDDECPMGPGYH